MRFQRTIMAFGALGGALGVASLSGPALAALDPADAMALCSRLSTNEARLECYDQVAKDVAEGRIQRNAAPAPQSAAPQPQAPAQAWTPPPPPSGVTNSGPSWAAPPQPSAGAAAAGAAAAGGFGADSVKRSTDERRTVDGPDAIEAQVVSSTDNGLEQWRMALADGAVWQMTERVPLFRPPKPNEVVTIRKGALGGFLMDVGKQASVRVMRVK